MKNYKNLKVRMLSVLTALTLGMMPTMANGETNGKNNTDDKAYVISTESHDLVPVSQEAKENPMTAQKYFDGVMMVSNDLSKHFSGYDADMKKVLMQEIECLYFLVNRDYVSKEVEDELVDGVIVNINGKDTLIKPIYETDMTRMADMSGIQNFLYANMFLNFESDYNQSKIRHTDNIDDLIDLSVFCYNENDKKIVRKCFEHYFNCHKNDTFDEEEFEKACKIVLSLNGEENLYNACNLSVGARWMLQLGLGNDLMQILRDYMLENDSFEELSKYFKKEELVRGQFFLRDDFTLDFNCLSNLEKRVFTFGELWKFCLDDVNNDIFKSFEGRCTKK